MTDDLLLIEIRNMLENNPNVGRGTVSDLLGISNKRARRLVKIVKDEIKFGEIVGEPEDTKELNILDYSANLQRQKQKLQDTQRIERKIRDKIRLDNAVAEYCQELTEVIKEFHPQPYTIKHETVDGNAYGIMCCSDWHLNELISLDGCNEFSFEVAAKRLKKFAIESARYFKANNVTNILIAGLGDLINSDRRPSELVCTAVNRSKASYLAVILIEQLILDLNQQGFNVSYTFVTGNESRVDEIYSDGEFHASHNYDWTISECLRLIFRGSEIEFIGGRVDEKVVNVNGKNILLLHGNQVGKGDIEKRVAQIKGKYASRGVVIDYIIFGHIHSAYIADMFARSASLCGANAYSDVSLQLTSRASQNIIIVRKDSIDGIKIDLQETGDIEGYEIEEQLIAYNAKSEDKVRKNNADYIVVATMR